MSLCCKGRRLGVTRKNGSAIKRRGQAHDMSDSHVTGVQDGKAVLPFSVSQ